MYGRVYTFFPSLSWHCKRMRDCNLSTIQCSNNFLVVLKQWNISFTKRDPRENVVESENIGFPPDTTNISPKTLCATSLWAWNHLRANMFTMNPHSWACKILMKTTRSFPIMWMFLKVRMCSLSIWTILLFPVSFQQLTHRGAHVLRTPCRQQSKSTTKWPISNRFHCYLVFLTTTLLSSVLTQFFPCSLASLCPLSVFPCQLNTGWNES